MAAKDVKNQPVNVWEQRKAAFPPNNKDIVAQVIGKPVALEDWDIIDSVNIGVGEDLVLAHYTDECDDLENYGKVRGVVVDIKRKFIACKSFGYSPIATTNHLSLSPDGSLSVIDNDNNKHMFPAGQFTVRRGYEGVIIRVFKHGGKVYSSTFRRLNIAKSRWGSAKTFLEMYKECGGPDFETLFDSAAQWSPFVWIFIVVHPQLLTASKQNVGEGYVKLLGIERLWDPTKPPGGLDVKQVEQVARDDVKVAAETFGSVAKGVTYPVSLTIDEANQHLTTGWYDPKTMIDIKQQDERVTPGEFLFVYGYQVPVGQLGQVGTQFITSILRIQSHAYTWRANIRDNDPNIKHRFYDLMRVLESPDAKQIDNFFNDTCVLFPDYKKDIEAAVAPLISLPAPLDESQQVPRSLEDRRRMLWLNLLMASPPQQQGKVSGLYREIKEDQDLTHDRLFKFLSTYQPRELLERIYNLKKESFLLGYYKATSYARKRGPSESATIHEYINKTIASLNTPQFYRLMVALRRLYNPVTK
jgi:hypothetical protein